MAGGDSEFTCEHDGISEIDADAADDDGGFPSFFALPAAYVYGDFKKLREVERLRKPADAMSVYDPDEPLQGQDDISISEAPIAVAPPELDSFGRQIIKLEHGDESHPHRVRDHSMLNLVLIGGISFQDGETYVLQYNAIAKLMYTRGKWSTRSADDYQSAIKMKNLSWPEKAEDFNDWANGDHIERRAIMGVGIYAGVSAIIPDIRAGGVLVGDWHLVFTKVDRKNIRASFTREGGVGFSARFQAVPLTKIEGSALKNFEGTLVYNFNISTELGRKRLERALAGHIFIRPESNDDDVTKLTERKIQRTRKSRKAQAGVPVGGLYRIAKHTDKFSSDLKTRNGNLKRTEVQTHHRQTAWRHLNLPKHNTKGKKLKYFLHHNYLKDVENQGFAEWNRNKSDDKKFTKLMLVVDISYNNDKVKVKALNHYNKELSKRVGLNDFDIDLNFTKQKKLSKSERKKIAHGESLDSSNSSLSSDDSDASSASSSLKSSNSSNKEIPQYREVEDKNKLIGFAKTSYHLKVGTEPLLAIINQAAEDKHLFDKTNNELIIDYFYVKNDPHGICRDRHIPYDWCVNFVKYTTKRTTDKIAHHLRKLKKIESKSRTSFSGRLLKVSRLCSKNQFVLGSFVSMLPERKNGYGIYRIKGEQFLAERFKVDPKDQRKLTNELDTQDPDSPFNNLPDEDLDNGPF